MKLTSVTIIGLRGIESETVQFSPVTLFVGPNGSGKTACLGAVVYALTGRFPGIVGDTAPALLALANDPVKGFVVTAVFHGQYGESLSQQLHMTRSVNAEGHTLTVFTGEKRAKGKDAEVLLRKLVGDVGWFVDAFDPERSIWRQSPEKRKAWAFELCAGAAGWTKERLVEALGRKTDDWNPDAATDPAAALEFNIASLSERLNGAQKVAREAKVVVDGIAAPTMTIDPRDLAEAESAVDAAKRRIIEFETQQRHVARRQAEILGVRRDRERLTAAIAKARADMAGMLAPTPRPMPSDDVSSARIADLEGDLMAADMAVDDARETWTKWRAAYELHARVRQGIEADIEAVEKNGHCPTCRAPGHQAIATLKLRLSEFQTNEAHANQNTGRLQRTLETAQNKRDAIHDVLTPLLSAQAEAKQRKAAEAREAERFDHAMRALLTTVQALETQLAGLPPDPVDKHDLTVSKSEIAADQAEATKAEFHARTRLQEMRAANSLSVEKAAQAEAQRRAEARVEELKNLLTQMRRTRDEMLLDATEPLTKALGQLDMLAPPGTTWKLIFPGSGIDIGYSRQTGQRDIVDGGHLVHLVYGEVIPTAAMSAGEKLRATLALLVARAMVRREPWTGIFVDNFEAIAPAEARVSVLRALAHVERSGFVDNVIVAGAMEPPEHVEGVKVVQR